jgi:hypothetical protein
LCRRRKQRIEERRAPAKKKNVAAAKSGQKCTIL